MYQFRVDKSLLIFLGGVGKLSIALFEPANTRGGTKSGIFQAGLTIIISQSGTIVMVSLCSGQLNVFGSTIWKKTNTLHCYFCLFLT